MLSRIQKESESWNRTILFASLRIKFDHKYIVDKHTEKRRHKLSVDTIILARKIIYTNKYSTI